MTKEKSPVVVGSVDDFPVGLLKICNVDGREIGVVQFVKGEFRAIRNSCPHKGAPICRGEVTGTWVPSEVGELKYDMHGRVLVCPWHGYEFNLDDGRELFQEKPARLLMFPVSVHEGNVTVLV